MGKNIKEIGGLSRKARINVFIVVFLIFILVAVFSSIKQISTIIQNREKLVELQESLNYERQENIKLLAEEKALYDEEAIEMEARDQFNMTKSGETNYFVELLDGYEESSQGYEGMVTGDMAGEDASGQYGKVYSESDLWGNIRILYENEIKK